MILDEDLDDLDDDDLDEDDDIEEDDFEHQESLDSEEDLEPLAASKKRVVKRKRKSVRNENDSNSDSDDEEPAVHRRHGGREASPEKTITDDHETEIIKSTKLNELKNVEDLEDLEDLEDDELLDDDELPKELLFTNIFTGPSRSFEARYAMIIGFCFCFSSSVEILVTVSAQL